MLLSDKLNTRVISDVIILILGELAAAIRNNTDIHFGLYYSLFEWFHPLFLQDRANGFETQTYVMVCLLRHLCFCVDCSLYWNYFVCYVQN